MKIIVSESQYRRVIKEEDIMGEIWQTVYNFMGLSMDLYSDRVRKCDKINNM